MPASFRFRPIRTAFLLLALALSARAVPAGFDHAVAFTVAGYEAGRPALADFPVLVRISEAAIPGFRYRDLRLPDGGDVCFVAPDGTPLAFEIDTWDTNDTSLAWVRLPSMTNATRFVMCYGSENAVVPASPWSAYAAVWHMDEESGVVADATGNGLAATPGGNYASNSIAVPGIIGNARRNAVSGQPGNLTVPDYDSQSVGDVFTVSGWFSMDADGSSDNRLFSRKSKSDVDGGWEAFARKGGGKILMRGRTNGSAVESTSSLALAGQGWKHFAFVFDGASGTIYVDGSPFASSGSLVEPTDNGEPLGIGAYNIVGTTSFYGSVDECRLIKGASSADWIAADHATQSSAAFLSNGGAARVSPSVLLVVGSTGAVAVAAAPGIWFDTDIAGYAEWPSDGGDFDVDGQGVWTGTAHATLDVSRHALAVDAPPGESLAFSPLAGRDVAEDPVAFLAVATVSSVQPLSRLAPLDATAKGGLAVADDGAGAKFYAWAEDPDSDPATNVWRELSGATPEVGAPLSVRADAKADGGTLVVQYAVDGRALAPAADGDGWLPVATADTTFDYAGMGGGNLEVSSLHAIVVGSATAVLSFPEMPPNVGVASVTTNGVAVEPDPGGLGYTVESGAEVVVTFATTDPGLVLAGAPASATVVLLADTTFPAGSVPGATPPKEAVRINEILASNASDGRVSANGGAEMDWIEVHNACSQDIDIAGWYLFDGPDKAKSKWKKIKGTCVVPAGGYRLVWCDKDYPYFDPALEAWSEINLSSDGESLFLAPPDTADLAADGIAVVDFPAQIKGYSYGLGTISHGEHAGDYGFVYFKGQSPEAPNDDEGWGPPTPEVFFDVPHGYKTEAFDVSLVCPNDPNATIYYTIDGTSPSPGSPSSRLYDTNSPIHVAGTTCIRAAVPLEGAILQLDSSATYLFVDDVLAQGSSPPAGFPSSQSVTSTYGEKQKLSYGMNQTVVNNNRARLLNGFTNDISTLSVVIDPENLFNAQTGIYVNAKQEGILWERQMVLEQIDPTNATGGFTIPAGLRIRGGNSRKSDHPKHAFRFFFRSSYGRSSLAFPLFGDENGAAQEFDKVDLRCSQNASWANENSAMETFVTEVFSRDSQRDMGQPYTRSRYYHLFLNGQYWGLYQAQERADEHWGEAYMGGDKLDYDLIKTASSWTNKFNGSIPSYKMEVNEGRGDAWSNLWKIATTEGFEGAYADNYRKILGQDPDGTRNTNNPILLDRDSLMAYMLVSHYVVDSDGPTSPYSSGDKGHPNNVYAIRNRVDVDPATGADRNISHGFVYLRHDAELSMGVNSTRNAAWNDPTFWGTEACTNFSGAATRHRQYAYFTPAELHYRLMKNPEYKRAYADAYYRHCLRPGGALTIEKSTERYHARMNEITNAIVCELARWGGGKTLATWTSACGTCLKFVTNRTDYMKTQYVTAGWYSDIDPPVATNGAGRALGDGDVLDWDNDAWTSERVYLASDAGLVYYTLNALRSDGADPRAANGEPSDQAVLYDGAGFALDQRGAKILARVRSGDDWSAPLEIDLDVDFPTDQMRGLRVAAVYASTAGDGDAGEFVVLTNILDRTVSLSNVTVRAAKRSGSFDDPSLSVTFEATNAIASNGTVTLTRERDWPEVDGSGKAVQKLTNGDAMIRITDANGKVCQIAEYSSNWWPVRTYVDNKGKTKYVYACDGTGAHLVALRFETTLSFDAGPTLNWRPSFWPPATEEGENAVSAAVAAAPAVKAWLDGLGETAAGNVAISNFTGTAEALDVCYLVDQMPTNAPEAELTIPEIGFDADGIPLVDGSLFLHGVESSNTVNGAVRLYYSDSLTNLVDSTNFVSLSRKFPIEDQAATNGEETPPAIRFYRLKIEK